MYKSASCSKAVAPAVEKSRPFGKGLAPGALTHAFQSIARIGAFYSAVYVEAASHFSMDALKSRYVMLCCEWSRT